MKLALVLLAALAGVVTPTEHEYHLQEEMEAGGTREREGARVDPAERGAAFWKRGARAALQALVERGGPGVLPAAPVRRVLLFVGDGMSVTTLAAARTWLGQQRGATGEETSLAFDSFPTVGIAKTYCVNAQIPDSACTATAYLCGVKTNMGMLGLTANVTRGDCAGALHEINHVSSIAAWALRHGRDAGIVTTTRVTHASPAGAYAHVPERRWESDEDVRKNKYDPACCRDIAYQLINNYPGKDFKVIMGGGMSGFVSAEVQDVFGKAGGRLDGRDLTAEWRAHKAAAGAPHAVVHDREGLRALRPRQHVLGLFASSHLKFAAEANATQPSLAAMTVAAMRALEDNERGYFLFVEGGRIDHGHHQNQPARAVRETAELSAAVAAAVRRADPADTLIVVTSDHSHVMTYSGYSPRGHDILGASNKLGLDGVPYMTLSYTNGPGARVQTSPVRPDVTKESDYRASPRWQAPAYVPLRKEAHGGEDVAVFAWGAGHALLAGLYEQAHIPHRLAYAACIGAPPTACDARAAAAAATEDAPPATPRSPCRAAVDAPIDTLPPDTDAAFSRAPPAAPPPALLLPVLTTLYLYNV